MQNNSDKLIKALNDSGLNQKKFAKALNISEGHLSEIVRGKKSPSSSLCELAQIRFGKPPDATESTFTGQGKQPYDSGVRLKEGESKKGTVEVGVYAFAGAGGPMELFEHDPIETIDIPQHWMKPDLQAVLIRGRSMEPSIVDGAVVGVDTQNKKIISGELYAVWLEYEGAVVKRLFIEQNIVRVCSDNPAFKEMQIKNDEINGDTFVLGKVTWLMQSY